jgi:DNA-binding MarR family transcriptional regulator
MVKTARDGSEQAGLTELVERLQLGKSTVTELVLRTEQRGLVRRELDPDRLNSILVRLTRAGEQRLAGALADLGNERRLIELVSTLR